MAVQSRTHRVHIQEQAAVRHLAQVHEVHLDAGRRQDGQSGAHRGVDLAGDDNESRARPHRRGHRVAELRPTAAEAFGARGILGRQVRPRNRGNLGQSRQGSNEGLGVEFFENFDGDDLTRHVEGGQARRLLITLAGHITPGHREQGTGHNL